MQNHELLQDLGYEIHLNKTAYIFANSVEKVISYLGEHSKNALISYISSLTKLPKNDCFLYYTITKNAFEHVFGEKSAVEILDLVKEEIVIQNGHSSRDSLEKIMNDLLKDELLNFIHNLNGSHHILYLYNDHMRRNELMSEFFSSSKSFNVLLSFQPTKLKNTGNFICENISPNGSTTKEKISELISNIQTKSTPDASVRLFGEDVSPWLNGSTSQCLEAEQLLDKHIKNNPLSTICACNISSIPNEMVLRQLISSHSYVIADEPFAVYMRGT